MKIKLDIKERLLLTEYLTIYQPAKGKYLDFLKFENLKKKILITNEEIQTVSMIQDEAGGITWDVKKETSMEYSLVQNEIELLVNICKMLDGKEEITPINFSLVSKFINVK